MTPEQIAVAIPLIEANVAQGFLVFPMATRKEPLYKGWQTKVWDLGVLEAELRQSNVMGYGITLPKDDPRRIVDLDMDDGKDGVKVGLRTWQDRLAAVEAEHGALPVTKTTLTPSGGIHRWYLWPEAAPLPGGSWHGFTVRQLYRARNYVLGPGSVRSDGLSYTIETPGTPISTVPEALARSGIKGAKSVDGNLIVITGPYDLPEVIEAGDCYPQVVSYTLSLWNRRMSLPEMWALVREAVGPRLTNPHTDEHLREHFDDATKDLATRFPRDEHGYLVEKAPRPVETTGIDAADLLALELAPLKMIVPGLLPEGTTTIASPPKVGKSCLVYQMAVEVAIGGTLLGERVATGSVLYLALEDGQRRGQARLKAALGDRTLPRGRLEVRWSAPTIGEGLEHEIAGWLDDHPDAVLVAIDTLQKVRQRTNGKWGAYEVDVDDLGRLQALFRDRPVALLIVHHSRKESGHDDFLASVSGTYGITGSVDTIIVIRRKRLETFGTIVVTGREIAENELPVQFDGMLWREAPASPPEASFERTEVYRTIEQHGPIFPAAIANSLGLSRQSVQNMVRKLVDTGAVARTTKGYQTPGITLMSPIVSGDSERHRRHGGYAREEQAFPVAPWVDYPRSAWMADDDMPGTAA